MTSVIRASASSAANPPVDLQQKCLARPRLLTFPETDAALANCRKVPDRPRRIGLPVACVRTIGESAFSNRAGLFMRRIEGFERCRDEMIFELTSPSCYSDGPFADFREPSSTEIHAPDDTPRRLVGGDLSNGMSAGV